MGLQLWHRVIVFRERESLCGLPLLVVALILGFAGARSMAVDSTIIREKKEAKAKVLFAPDVETKFIEFLKKVKEAKRRNWQLHMEREINEALSAAGLNAEGVSALKAASQQCIDECVEIWSPKFEDYIRKVLQRSSMDLIMFFERNSQIEYYAKYSIAGEIQEPEERTSWSETLQRTLTGAQAAALEKARTESKRKFVKECGGLLKSMSEVRREELRTTILAKSADVKRVLSLAKERADALDALAKSAAEQSVSDWGKRAEKALFSLEQTERALVMKTGNFYVPFLPKELPEQQAVWKEGLKNFFGAEDLQRLQTDEEAHRARRIRALGQIMLVELDRKAAFTAKQRSLLQPVAERLIKDWFSDAGTEIFVNNVQTPTLFAAAASAEEEETNPILDSVQWKHWKYSCNPKNIERSRYVSVGALNPGVDGQGPARIPEPEDVENGISEFLSQKSAKQGARMLAVMILKAEDAGRVAGLEREKIERLKTAARGAAEETLTEWKSAVENTVRSRVDDATCENLRQRLGGIQEYYFENAAGRVQSPEKKSVWDKTVNSEMTAEERARWKKELDARIAYRDKSIGLLILSEFDRVNPLSEEQWEKLELMFARMVTEYGPEMLGCYVSNDSFRWYLQSYSMFVPLGGIPEKDFKSILSKEQWERWTRSNEFANCVSEWDSVRQMHEQRLGVKK